MQSQLCVVTVVDTHVAGKPMIIRDSIYVHLAPQQGECFSDM